ncbi:MAG: MoaF N-terminal domain-containing protein [Oscillospiraceae bacterium]|jgi:hypothetical protein|nr:MoaF N-terminal domain-containing protein [Oscillospiraceae bacterium]
MDLRELSKYGQGDIDHYAPPASYELVGQRFYFIMDDGKDYELNFVSREALEWNFVGEAPQKAEYICSKGEETTYLVSYELGTTPRSNHTYVIDLENWLVTRISAKVGENARYPYLITPRYEFGAIRRDGVEPTFKRHGYTSDLIGNIVQWNYGGMETVHIYYCANYYRITYPPERASSQMFNETLAKLPSSDEPTAYIKIKEGVYLFSLTEANMERLVGAAMPFRSNTMCFIQNYKSVTLIGRAFGTLTYEDGDHALHKMFGAVGKVLEPANTPDYIQKLLTDPNPYQV